MSATRPADILRRLEPPAPPDAELLRRFAAARDEAAFAELLRRHGPAGARRVPPRHRQPARRGRRVPGHLPRARPEGRAAARRRAARELVVRGRVPHLSEGPARGRPAPRPGGRHAAPAGRARPAHPARTPGASGRYSTRELAALAACYRDAIVLCDLQGASREAAARALGVPEGTVSSRLANGRKKLAARLARAASRCRPRRSRSPSRSCARRRFRTSCSRGLWAGTRLRRRRGGARPARSLTTGRISRAKDVRRVSGGIAGRGGAPPGAEPR
jgi:hypothetical protein